MSEFGMYFRISISSILIAVLYSTSAYDPGYDPARAAGWRPDGKDIHYKHIKASKTFCKSEHIADWTTEELKSKRQDLNWYIHFGNGVCNVGNNGGVAKCAGICKDIAGCRYFSVSTTTRCYACWIYKTCDSPISTDHDYKIYEMQEDTVEETGPKPEDMPVDMTEALINADAMYIEATASEGATTVSEQWKKFITTAVCKNADCLIENAPKICPSQCVVLVMVLDQVVILVTFSSALP